MGTFTLNIATAKVAMLPNQRLAIIWLSEPMHYQLVPRELNLFDLDQNHEFVPIQENIELVSAKDGDIIPVSQRPRQNGCHSADEFFQINFPCIFIKLSPKFIPKSPTDHDPARV